MRAPTRGRSAQQRARRRGQTAEFLCRWHLRMRGWRIVARDWRCPVGEIDIVARRGSVLAIIEVKARGNTEAALAAIAPRQRQRIVRAASAFLVTRPDLAGLMPRFDVMIVAPLRPPRHLPDAWQADP